MKRNARAVRTTLSVHFLARKRRPLNVTPSAHRHEIAFSVVTSGGTPTREEEPLTCASSELGLILSFETLLRGQKEKNDPYLGETQPSFSYKYYGIISRDTVAS